MFNKYTPYSQMKNMSKSALKQKISGDGQLEKRDNPA
jgi:hypothetical protein